MNLTFVRGVMPTVVALVWLLSVRSTVHGSPASAKDPNSVLNHRLALMALAPAVPRAVHAADLENLLPRVAANEHRNPDWWSGVSVNAIVSHFTSAERFLHFRHGGVDANFWGVMNRGGSVRIKYSIRLRRTR